MPVAASSICFVLDLRDEECANADTRANRGTAGAKEPDAEETRSLLEHADLLELVVERTRVTGTVEGAHRPAARSSHAGLPALLAGSTEYLLEYRWLEKAESNGAAREVKGRRT